MMDWLLAEMSRARGDVERRMREKILDILEECEPYRHLGRLFTFRSSGGLDDSVNERLIELVDGIMEDVESRSRRAAEEAGVEDEYDAVVAYAKSPIDGRDLVSRLDGHASTLKYFLEGWVAIGFVQSMSRQELVNEIFSYMGNPYASNLFFEAFKEGYSALSISSRGYSFGKGNMRNVMEAMSLAEETAINRAFQYGSVRRYAKDGAIGYRTHRGSTFDCAYCDELTKSIHPLTDIVLPAHPRCMCYSTPVYKTEGTDENTRESLANEQKIYRKELQKAAIEKYKGTEVVNVVNIKITSSGIKEFLNQPHVKYIEKNELVRNLPNVISSSEYLGSVPYHKSNPNIVRTHIFGYPIGGTNSYLLAREELSGDICFYSVTDSDKILEYLKTK